MHHVERFRQHGRHPCGARKGQAPLLEAERRNAGNGHDLLVQQPRQIGGKGVEVVGLRAVPLERVHPVGKAVVVNGNKQVGVLLYGHRNACGQFHRRIALAGNRGAVAAGHNHACAGILQLLFQSQGNRQVRLRLGQPGRPVRAAGRMPGIDHDPQSAQRLLPIERLRAAQPQHKPPVLIVERLEPPQRSAQVDRQIQNRTPGVHPPAIPGHNRVRGIGNDVALLPFLFQPFFQFERQSVVERQLDLAELRFQPERSIAHRNNHIGPAVGLLQHQFRSGLHLLRPVAAYGHVLLLHPGGLPGQIDSQVVAAALVHRELRPPGEVPLPLRACRRLRRTVGNVRSGCKRVGPLRHHPQLRGLLQVQHLPRHGGSGLRLRIGEDQRIPLLPPLGQQGIDAVAGHRQEGKESPVRRNRHRVAVDRQQGVSRSDRSEDEIPVHPRLRHPDRGINQIDLQRPVQRRNRRQKRADPVLPQTPNGRKKKKAGNDGDKTKEHGHESCVANAVRLNDR